jgi:hypothetical protein
MFRARSCEGSRRGRVLGGGVVAGVVVVGWMKMASGGCGRSERSGKRLRRRRILRM